MPTTSTARVPAQRRPGETTLPDAPVDAVTGRSLLAQRAFVGWGEPAVDRLLAAVAGSVAAHAPELAAAAVRETGMGNAPDKVAKIRFASTGVQASLAGRPGAGVLRHDRRRRVLEVAVPVGVVLGLTPVTNPVATLVFKALIALKGRNALIVSPHHRAPLVSARVGELVRTELTRHGAPPDLVQCLDPSWGREQVRALMRAPGVALVLATGGAGVVRAAYSSGTPAIGVGPGNTPAWVAHDADVDGAARDVVGSKSFDHGIICGSEQHVVVDARVEDQLLRGLRARGAAVLAPAEVARVASELFDSGTGRLRPDLVGTSAPTLAAAAGVHVDPRTRLLVAPLSGTSLDAPWSVERLAPLLTLRTVADAASALELCRSLLVREGTGHTAVVHTRSRRLVRDAAAVLPVSRLLVNAPASQGCVGMGTGLTPSFTLGCGAAGGTSTTDNVSFEHLVDVVRVADGGPRWALPAWGRRR